MNKIDYQALREKAEKATCGEWALEYGDGRFDGDDALIHREAAGYIPICRIEGAHPESGFDEDFQMEQQANAEFIAAANPATVLVLLDERERNQQYIKRRDQENEDIALTVGKLRVELEAAEKRTAELESLAAPQLPQPAVVVSEAQSKKLFDEWSGGDGALGELRASGVPDEFISMLKEFSLATWEACREAMIKHSAPFIVTSDHRMMEMPAIHDIDAVAAMLQGADVSITHEGNNHHKDKLAMVDHSGGSNNMVEPVTTTYKLPFEQWLSKQTGTIDVECGCVMTEVFYHWLRVAYEAGNSPVIQDGWVAVPVDMTPEMMRAVQINSELGAYAAANLTGAYSLFREFWDVAVKSAPNKEAK